MEQKIGSTRPKLTEVTKGDDWTGKLLRAGFSRCGCLRLEDNGSAVLEGEAPSRAGIYAYVVDGGVVYIGAAQEGIRDRMASYCRNQAKQKSTRPVHGEIANVLRSGRVIDVLFAHPEDGVWNDLPVNTLSGLEGGLIKAIDPKWNRRGRVRRKKSKQISL